jgi:hypothetical protein
MEQKSLQSVQQSYIEFCLCYAYVVNPVSLTPKAYSRLLDLRSVRHLSFVAYPCIIAPFKSNFKIGANFLNIPLTRPYENNPVTYLSSIN